MGIMIACPQNFSSWNFCHNLNSTWGGSNNMGRIALIKFFILGIVWYTSIVRGYLSTTHYLYQTKNQIFTLNAGSPLNCKIVSTRKWRHTITEPVNFRLDSVFTDSVSVTPYTKSTQFEKNNKTMERSEGKSVQEFPTMPICFDLLPSNI